MYFHQMAGVKMFTAASCIITKNWNDPFYGGGGGINKLWSVRTMESCITIKRINY